MAPTIEFFYDVVCPWAFIASRKIEKLAAKYPAVTIKWSPVLLGGIYNLTKAPQGKDGSASDVMAKSKRVIHTKDLFRTLERNSLRIKWHPQHPVRSVDALRLLHAVDQDARPALTHKLYEAYWIKNLDVSDRAILLALAKESTIPPSKFSFPLTEDLFTQPPLVDALKDTTSRLVEHGGPGVPCFLVNGEKLFWGQDHLHFVESMLVGASVPQERLSAPGQLKVPRKLTVFWDFSSPWSYIGFTQIERMKAEAGPLLQVEHVPILVGGLFKEIGTPNVPMLAVPPIKREYAARDMSDWVQYWSALPYPDGTTPKPLNFRFPTVFPIRSVTPLRVAIVEPALSSAIFSAAWEQDIDIADPVKLAGVIDRAGFSAAAILEKAGSQEVKDKLRNNNTRAVEIGLCGVPTYVVDEVLLWGQDRINIAMDLLHGGAKSRMATQFPGFSPASNVPEVALESVCGSAGEDLAGSAAGDVAAATASAPKWAIIIDSMNL
ncbi:hypothetical protein HDU96_003057 [Phlyctochytrium bullatum]|nr:hypothetical protein HDU96_003057 [Phlyctochytrium bullatum]